MEYNTDHFLSMLAKMNISLSYKQLQQFMTYYEMLIEKNKVMNLTAITDFDDTGCGSSSAVKSYRSWNWCGVSGNPIKNCFSGIKCGAG